MDLVSLHDEVRDRNGESGMEGAVTKDRGAHDSLPLRTVSRLTGLSADIIRVWERRYGVVAHARGPRGARLYSTEDVAQLRLLRRAVSSGRAIGDIARLSRGALENLVGTPEPTAARAPATAARGTEILDQAIGALERFD